MSAIGKIVCEEMTETEVEKREKEEAIKKEDSKDDTESKDDEVIEMENGEPKKENEQNGEEDDIECVAEIEADTSKQNGDLNTTKDESKTISDAIFFENISQDEKDFYAEEGQKPEDIGEMSIQCTACWKQVNRTFSSTSLKRGGGAHEGASPPPL